MGWFGLESCDCRWLVIAYRIEKRLYSYADDCMIVNECLR